MDSALDRARDLCRMRSSFLLGDFLVTDEWAKQDKDTLTQYKPGGLFVGLDEPIIKVNENGAGGAPERVRPRL